VGKEAGGHVVQHGPLVTRGAGELPPLGPMPH
jgi:hypothetical protein